MPAFQAGSKWVCDPRAVEQALLNRANGGMPSSQPPQPAAASEAARQQYHNEFAAAIRPLLDDLLKAHCEQDYDAAAQLQRKLDGLGVAVRFKLRFHEQAEKHYGPAAEPLEAADLPRGVGENGEPIELITATQLAKKVGTNTGWVIERAERGSVPHFKTSRGPLFDPEIAQRAIVKLSLERMSPPESSCARAPKTRTNKAKELTPHEQREEKG